MTWESQDFINSETENQTVTSEAQCNVAPWVVKRSGTQFCEKMHK